MRTAAIETSIDAFHAHRATGQSAAQRNRLLAFITATGGVADGWADGVFPMNTFFSVHPVHQQNRARAYFGSAHHACLYGGEQMYVLLRTCARLHG